MCAGNAADAEKLLEGDIVHAIVCDQRMPHESGVSFLKRVRDIWPDPVRMIISGYSDCEDIIAGLNEAGIYQYITKPWQPDGLVDIAKKAVQLYRLQKETETAGVDVKATPGHVRPRIHYGSARANKAFVVENCGALPDELLESELFGCKKGAAYQDRIGLFEVADGGTIFLDEIGETSPALQVKLLRVLQESEIRPLGAQRVRKVDVRVVAATNRDLEAESQRRYLPEFYSRILTTRTLQGRIDTLAQVRDAGIKVCCGGMLGMGERVEDRLLMLVLLANLPKHPESCRSTCGTKFRAFR